MAIYACEHWLQFPARTPSPLKNLMLFRSDASPLLFLTCNSHLLEPLPKPPTRPPIPHPHHSIQPKRPRTLIKCVPPPLHNLAPHPLPQPLQPLPEILPFPQQHVPLAHIQRDTVWQRCPQRFVRRRGGGGVRRCHAGAGGEVGGVEEGGEE